MLWLNSNVIFGCSKDWTKKSAPSFFFSHFILRASLSRYFLASSLERLLHPTSFFSPWNLPFLVVFFYNIFECIFISASFWPLCSSGYGCNRFESWQTKVLFYSGGDCLLSKMAPPNKSCLAIFNKVAIWQLYVMKITIAN